MIAFLKGKVQHKDTESIILEVNNIGYRIFVPENWLARVEVGQEKTVLTALYNRDDTIELFGMPDEQSFAVFILLQKVPKVGPRSALKIIGAIGVNELKSLIASRDIKSLVAVPGIGNKLAERLVSELYKWATKEDGEKNTRGAQELQKNGNTLQEVSEALLKLGYARSEVVEALRTIPKNMSAEQMLKEALKRLKQ